MKILIDIRPYHKNRFSGISFYTRIITDKLLEKDEENQYLLFANGVRNSLGDWRPQADILNYHIPNRLFELSSRFLSLPRIDELARADVVYSPNINILALKNTNRRVLTVHDLSFVHFPQYFSRRACFWHWRQNYKNQIKSAGRVIADSENTAKDIVEVTGVSSRKVRIIYPGIDPFYRPLNLERELTLLYLGAFEPRKNIQGIVRAFNILKKKPQFSSLKLVLAGTRAWLYKEIFKEIKSSAFNEDIILKEGIDRNEALHLYNTASVFVYPSFFEGFGFPPLEAQACGLPVVASNRSSLPEVLGESALLADPWRVDEIVMGIEEILKDEKLQEKLRTRGFQNVKRFNWDNTAEKMISVFKEVGDA